MGSAAALMPTYSEKVIHNAWQSPVSVLHLIKMNEVNNYNEQDAQTAKLLDMICEGIEVPTDEEMEDAYNSHH